MPSPGTITALRTPSGPWVRDDSGFYEGAVVPSHYDPLVSKLSVWAPDRASAIQRMRRALSEYVVTGIRTNLVFHEKLLAQPDFVAGRYHTGFIAEHAQELLGYTEVPPEQQTILAAAIAIGAARADRGIARAEGEASEALGRLSPWVHQHRARTLR